MNQSNEQALRAQILDLCEKHHISEGLNLTGALFENDLLALFTRTQAADRAAAYNAGWTDCQSKSGDSIEEGTISYYSKLQVITARIQELKIASKGFVSNPNGYPWYRIHLDELEQQRLALLNGEKTV